MLKVHARHHLLVLKAAVLPAGVADLVRRIAVKATVPRHVMRRHNVDVGASYLNRLETIFQATSCKQLVETAEFG